MGLRMKNFNILGVHWEIQFLGGRGYEKPIQMGELSERVVWTVCRFKGRGGGLARNGVVFLREGVWDPNAHNGNTHTIESSCRCTFRSSFSIISDGPVQPKNTYSCVLKVTGQVWESQKNEHQQ